MLRELVLPKGLTNKNCDPLPADTAPVPAQAGTETPVVPLVSTELLRAISDNNDRLISTLTSVIDGRLSDNNKVLHERQKAISQQYDNVLESLSKYSALFDETIKDINTIKVELKDVRKARDEVTELKA